MLPAPVDLSSVLRVQANWRRGGVVDWVDCRHLRESIGASWKVKTTIQLLGSIILLKGCVCVCDLGFCRTLLWNSLWTSVGGVKDNVRQAVLEPSSSFNPNRGVLTYWLCTLYNSYSQYFVHNFASNTGLGFQGYRVLMVFRV